MKMLYGAAFATMVTAFITGMYVGGEIALQRLKEDAIKSGVAEWVIEYNETDFSDVKRGFRWKARK